MAEHSGPIDGENDKSDVFGSYRFDSPLTDDADDAGFELPPWTDPPTGEMPKVLAELENDEAPNKSRFSAFRFGSFLSSGSQSGFDGLGNEAASEAGGVVPSGTSSYTRREIRENRANQRPVLRRGGGQRGGSPSEHPEIGISVSGRLSNQTDGHNSIPGEEDVASGERLFTPPSEKEIPTKRLNLSVPKLRGAPRHLGSSSRKDPQGLFDEKELTPESNPVEESLVSSFASRKARLSRTKTTTNPFPKKRKRISPVRIATGLGLGVVVLLAFQFGPNTALVVVSFALLIAIIEFYDTIRRAGYRPATLLGIAATLSLLLTTFTKGANGAPLVFAFLVIASMLWYLIGVIRGRPTINISVTFLGVLWIGGLGAFAAAILRPQDFPHSHGVAYLLGAIIATVANDTVAYFFGSWFGRHKMAPEISPTKSWEGFIGGALASVLVSAVVVSRIHPWTTSGALFLGIVVAIVAPLGDLSESMIKRDLGTKDMGKLLPGHGGMLDRIDGLLFVLPTVYYLLKILNLS